MPETEILSTGSVDVYTHEGETLTFKDWRPHGLVDMRRALGVSSNVYFYAIGGGYGRQSGLGVEAIVTYLSQFGIGEKTGMSLVEEAAGMLPTPAWKLARYGDSWRLADTYHLAIGQHAYAVTPLQMTRATAALATNGRLVTPTLLRMSVATSSSRQLPIVRKHFATIHDGLTYAVQRGTAAGLYQPGRSLAVKTGTAEADAFKTAIHSWVIGYFPAHKPQYAFTFLLTSGPWGEETGSVAVTADVMRWMEQYRPEYLYTP
jgi:penicillin-binding protein 2